MSLNILVIDTATEACSVALQSEHGVISRFEVCPQEHSRKLLPMVQEVLCEADLQLTQLDVLGVGAGPGSFTGVRIAMGMVQGLSFGAGLPIVKVSTLQAMAQQCHANSGSQSVISLIDARMSEVYFGHYQLDENGLMQLQNQELVISPEALVDGPLSQASEFAGAGTGWKAYEQFSTFAPQDISVTYPDARWMLPMAKYQWQQGHTFEAAKIEPTYLRDKVTWKKLPGR
ncbi:tRNA (adenosine(37)-N6)-threonylcarbamoyltransferase complex dimerization subunit type 1 TsaB [Planctobacterium marinum]|uniref:tRNA threonylcarbamoyladenosine biosynthesis protein TsaB n=1 Tax=Planctobacterium marinum TaxID=1631968 RepID=A0AA48KNY9_9ALTE|nr:tRNA threonylcarbamoyladenosine biosynthesis protein TsaB [Planctobacterium marinum]